MNDMEQLKELLKFGAESNVTAYLDSGSIHLISSDTDLEISESDFIKCILEMYGISVEDV